MAEHGAPVMAFMPTKDEAVEYIRRMGWTQEDVRLIYDREDDAYLVIARRRLF